MSQPCTKDEVRPLVDFLGADDPSIRKTAATRLGQLGGRAVPALTDLSHEGSVNATVALSIISEMLNEENLRRDLLVRLLHISRTTNIVLVLLGVLLVILVVW